MKFGKVEHPENVKFTLPPISNGSQRFLNELPAKKSSSVDVYIGATGWSMPEWKQSIYPKGIKAKDYLPHYSKHFNTIEFNTTHYRIPNFTQIEKWVANSVEDFKFCPKVPQTISHRKDLGLVSGQLDLFLEAIAGFGKKLGSCFLQLPPYFGPDRLDLLTAFLKAWPIEDFELCIEFRQEDWFKNQGIVVFEKLRQLKVGSVITDGAGRRDVLHQEITANYTIIRFVGNGMITSDLNRMTAWKSLLQSAISNGLSHCYFFSHQPDNILGPEAASFFGNAIKTAGLATRFPNLENPLFDGQGSLF